MSDKSPSGHLSKIAKELFRDGFKAFKEGLKGAEGALAVSSHLEAEASRLLGQSSSNPGLSELPKILFQLSQSTSVGAVMTSANGSELMANNAFYSLTKVSGGAGGASGTSIKLRKGVQGEEIDPPWARSNSWRKATFERLFVGEGEGGHFLDFYCQPLLSINGEFEGAFTLVADASEEVTRQEKLKELVFAVQDQLDGLKQSTDQLTIFLKGQEQAGALAAVSTAASDHESNLAESSSSRTEKTRNRLEKDVADSPPARASSNGIEVDERSTSDRLDAVTSGLSPEPGGGADESDFDPAALQEAVESASAFILDQEASGFAEPDDVDGPEELWQEMSDGLAEVLNVEETESAKVQDINLTILEEKRPKGRVVADKNSEPLFKDPAGGPATCLVVDDIPVNQKLLVFQLKHFGLNIDTASSGSEALDLIAKNNYQIVFMDCDMPRMSGFDTTVEIRSRESNTGNRLPIVGMTSHDRDGDKQKCLRSGMNDALPKGVSETELRKAMAGVLGLVEIIKPTESGHEPERTFDPQELEELISTFLYAMEMFVSSMQRAIDEKDSSLVRELASSVSGPSRVLGLHDMNKVSQEMVRLSSSGDWPQVRLKYLKLKTVYMRCQEDLRKLCPQAFSQVSATH